MRAIALPFLFFVFLLNSCGKAEERNEFAANLAPLLDPAKLDSLKGKRAATPRLRKACYWLEIACREEKKSKELSLHQGENFMEDFLKARTGPLCPFLVYSKNKVEPT